MSASLRLHLTDAAGDDLHDQVVIDLFATTSSNHLQAAQKVEGELVVLGVLATPVTLYRVVISPANHRTVQFFLTFTDGEEIEFTAAVPVDPGKVVSIAGPTYDQLPGIAKAVVDAAECPSFLQEDGAFVTGRDLYDLLDVHPLFKACLLNIITKSAETPLVSGRTCLEHYGPLLSLAPDRVFLKTGAALVEEASHSALFHPVPFALHAPLPGFHLISSYKTFDHYGNLQLTFQRRGDSGNDYVVDIDIDDAQGIDHIFQVVRNSVHGPTNPYNIRDILLRQTPRVDPGYKFVFAAAAALRAG